MATASATAKSGKMFRTGESRSSNPSSTSCMIRVAVQTLLIEPIWNNVSGVAATPVRVLTTPDVTTVRENPLRVVVRIPSEAPGTPYFALRVSSRYCQ